MSMNEPKWNAIMWISIIVTLCAALVASVYVVGNALTAAHVQGTKRIAICVKSGGTWLDMYSICLRDGQEVK